MVSYLPDSITNRKTNTGSSAINHKVNVSQIGSGDPNLRPDDYLRDQSVQSSGGYRESTHDNLLPEANAEVESDKMTFDKYQKMIGQDVPDDKMTFNKYQTLLGNNSTSVKTNFKVDGKSQVIESKLGVSDIDGVRPRIDTLMNFYRKNPDFTGNPLNYVTNKNNQYVDEFGSVRDDGWNPKSGKYDSPSGQKFTTSSGYTHNIPFHNKPSAGVSWEGGTDMWISGKTLGEHEKDRFGQKTSLTKLRSSQQAGQKYNNIVAKWQTKFLGNSRTLSGDKLDKRKREMITFVNDKLAVIGGWSISAAEKKVYTDDLKLRKKQLISTMGRSNVPVLTWKDMVKGY